MIGFELVPRSGARNVCISEHESCAPHPFFSRTALCTVFERSVTVVPRVHCANPLSLRFASFVGSAVQNNPVPRIFHAGAALNVSDVRCASHHFSFCWDFFVVVLVAFCLFFSLSYAYSNIKNCNFCKNCRNVILFPHSSKWFLYKEGFVLFLRCIACLSLMGCVCFFSCLECPVIFLLFLFY